MFRKLLLNCSLSLGTLIFCLIIAEIVCRTFFPDLKIQYENDTELLVRFKPNQQGILYLRNGSPAPRVRINEYGLRGTSLKEASSRRILFLGDSFTFGLGVEEDEAFPSLTGYALGEEISTINGGQPGYGVYQLEGLFRRLAPIVRPELVVVVIWQNQLLRQPLSAVERDIFLERAAKVKRLKSLSVLGTYAYRVYERFMLILPFNRLVVALGTQEEMIISDSAQYWHALKADSERLLTIQNTARSHGAKLMFVFWPREGFARTGNTDISAEITSKLRAFSENNQIRFYSVQSTLEVYPSDKLSIPFDGHPTAFAHCVVARKLVSSLGELGYHAERAIVCTNEGPGSDLTSAN